MCRLYVCNYCGKVNVEAHKRHKHMCVECGKLYDRLKSARRRGNEEKLKQEIAQKTSRFKRLLKDKEVKPDMTKVCKQCGRTLPVDNFRKYTPRGKGIYNTTQGRYTICKDCESVSNRTNTALKNGDNAAIEKLREHYAMLMDRGFPPVTAPAKRILDLVDDYWPKDTKLDQLLDSFKHESELEAHCRLVRTRGYASFDEADEVHRRLDAELRESGLYEEITDLLDEWYMEG